RSPNGVGRGTRTARWSVRHAAALQRLSVKQSRPTASAATQLAIGHNTATLSPFLFCFIHVVCPFALSLTLVMSAPSQKGRNKEKRRHDPTVPPQANTLLHRHCRAGDRSHIAESAPQCAPHHRAVNDGLDAAMHRPLHFPTTQVLRARTKQQTESECTQT
ncbi:hypothetical protein TcCL_Unassigned02082, partial [Trypanosoma cruzi]